MVQIGGDRSGSIGCVFCKLVKHHRFNLLDKELPPRLGLAQHICLLYKVGCGKEGIGDRRRFESSIFL